MKDKLWFLVAQRVSQSNTKIPLLTAYFPQGGTSDSGGQVAPHSTVRLTYQISQRNKFVFAFYKSQGGTQRFDVGCTATSGNSVSCISPEAAYWLPTPLQYAAQAKYTSPITSRFLLEIGQSLAVPTYKFKYQPENGPFDVDHFNRTTSVRTVASRTAPQDYFNEIWNTIANVSYVTGSHNLKAGVNQEWGWSTVKVEPHGDMSVLDVHERQRCRDADFRRPPATRRTSGKDVLKANLGLFAQDKWTIDRLTLTYGARYDYFNGYAPAQDNPAGRFVPARHSDQVTCIPCWNDWSIRAGASYDLFGTGKTALKTSVGKFLAQQALGLTATLNPMAAQTRYAHVDGSRRQRLGARRCRQRAVQRVGTVDESEPRDSGRRSEDRRRIAARHELGRERIGSTRAAAACVRDRRLLSPSVLQHSVHTEPRSQSADQTSRRSR